MIDGVDDVMIELAGPNGSAGFTWWRCASVPSRPLATASIWPLSRDRAKRWLLRAASARRTRGWLDRSWNTGRRAI